MVDRLLCPAGLCCLAIFACALAVWWNAFPKWPMIAMTAKAVMGGAVAVLLVVVPPVASAQEMTREEAEAEAAALASDLEGDVKDGATQSVTADTVPGFISGNPPETSHYVNPAGLESVGLAGMVTHEGSQFVMDSITSRPIITADELATWTTNGLAVEGDATSLVTEYGGAYGDCTTTVTGGTATQYTYACNEGETLLEFADACEIPLNVTFEQNYVYRCAWRWLSGDLSYEPHEDCLPLFSNSTCTNWTHVSGGWCGGYDPWACGYYGGADIILEATCSEPVPPLTPVRTIPGDPVDTLDMSLCDPKDADPHCALLAEICVEPAETRVIDGVSVTRDCWRWEKNYQCAALGGVVDDCAVPAGCTLSDSTCLSTDNVTGECRTWEHTYACTGGTSGGGAVGYCEEDVYCIDGDCNSLTRPQNTEFHQAVSALEMLGQLEDDADAQTLEVFPGEYAKCDKVVAGLQNCCSNDGFLTAIGFGCSADDKALADKQAAGLCHYNGVYCSKKTLFGICLKKRRTFCCFNNKLARIIHEQGRPQVRWDWGSAKHPDCSGFTVALFQQLDLSVMDFSEFYNDVMAGFSPPDGGAAAADITSRIINAYSCPPNC